MEYLARREASRELMLAAPAHDDARGHDPA
jgi:hypothetical protein